MRRFEAPKTPELDIKRRTSDIKKNEEIYIILSGKGSAVLDGEKVDFAAGDVIRIAPAVKRQFSAAADSAVSYACIQVRENSLEEYTAGDAVIG